MVGSLIVTGLLLALLARGPANAWPAPSSCTSPAPATGRSIPEATIAGFYLWPNIIAVAMTASPLDRPDHRPGLLLNSLPDRVQLLHRHDPRSWSPCRLDRLLPEWVSKVNERSHAGQRPPGLLPGQHPGDPRLQPGAGLGRPDAGRDLRLRLRLHHHLPGGALLPYRAKEVYDASPGAKYTVSGLVATALHPDRRGGVPVDDVELAPSAFGSVRPWSGSCELVALVGVILLPLSDAPASDGAGCAARKRPGCRRWACSAAASAWPWSSPSCWPPTRRPGQLGLLRMCPTSLWAQIIAFGDLSCRRSGT